MKTKTLPISLVIILALALLLSACGNATPETKYIVVTATMPVISATNTPDPCAAANIEAEVQKVHKFMREFDDASSLAGSIMQGVSKGQAQISELSNQVPNLQRIRREAEDQPTPACLVNLKTIQVSHMYAVLNSLTAFVGGDQQTFDQNVLLARQQHDQYALELARLLGQTVVPIAPSASETPKP